MINSDVKIFFDNFVTDFKSFDGRIIASRYFAPYISVSSDGSLKSFSEQVDIEQYFQKLLDDYAQQGVISCSYEELESIPIGNSCMLATVTWSMISRDGEAVTTWRESYTLVNTTLGFKIFTSIDH